MRLLAPILEVAHDVKAGQIEGFSRCDRNSSGIQHLQEEIEHEGVRLFNFVKENHLGPGLIDPTAQDAFFVSVLSQEESNRFLFLVFGHIEPGDLIFPEEVARESKGQFCFSDSRWTEKEKRSFGATWMGKA